LTAVLLSAVVAISVALFPVSGASNAENEAPGRPSETPSKVEDGPHGEGSGTVPLSLDRSQEQSASETQYSGEDQGRVEPPRDVDSPQDMEDTEDISATVYYDFYDRWLAREGDTTKVLKAKDAPSEGSAPGVRAPERSLSIMEPSTPYSQVVDNATPRRFHSTRDWKKRPKGTASKRGRHYGEDFEHTRPARDSSPARFKVNVPEDGFYTVYARWPAARGNNPATRFRIRTASKLKRVEVNQRRDGGIWVRLGSYKMEADDGYSVQVAGRSKAEGRIVADAVMVVAGTQSPPRADAGGDDARRSGDGQTPASGNGTAAGAEVVDRARMHIGTPYRHSPPMPCVAYRSEDCSCLTKLAFSEWTTLVDDPVQQWQVGRSIERSALLPGDLVFFKEAGEGNPITHVGIYSGSGNIVHSSSYWGQVVERPMSSVSGYYGARRLN
jgi:cell wall-associated NlpC family hydrolase